MLPTLVTAACTVPRSPVRYLKNPEKIIRRFRSKKGHLYKPSVGQKCFFVCFGILSSIFQQTHVYRPSLLGLNLEIAGTHVG
jgi:hypothetical protein